MGLGTSLQVHTKVGIITTILPPLFAASNARNDASVTTVEADILKPVVAALRMIVLQHFPSPSTALPTTDPRSADFESLLAALLTLLSESKSALVLDLLLPTLREGPSHAYAHNIDRGLADYVVGLSDLRMCCMQLFQISCVDFTCLFRRRCWKAVDFGVRMHYARRSSFQCIVHVA